MNTFSNTKIVTKGTALMCVSIALLLFMGATLSTVHAGELSVSFEADPLFFEANFLPGEEVVRSIEVGNTSDFAQDIIVEAINASDKEGFGEELNLVIKEGATTLYSDTLAKFLRAGEVDLSTLPTPASTVYSFGVTFESDAGNEFQATTLGFDLCIGFKGGATSCGDTVASEEEDFDGDGTIVGDESEGATLHGTGSTSPPPKLKIAGESAVDFDPIGGTALISWTTNLLSTSQVVYGLSSGAPYSLDLSILPNFGYPLGSIEDTFKVTEHSVLITGLIPGESYKYRVVSRASPPSIGFEQEFYFEKKSEVTTHSETSVGGGALLVGEGGSGGTLAFNSAEIHQGTAGSIAPNSDEPTSALSEEGVVVPSIEKREGVSNTATALFALPVTLTGWLFYVFFFSLIIIILLYIAYWISTKPEKGRTTAYSSSNI